jgi:hypothetical protein
MEGAMRPVDYTITPRDVEECSTIILQDAIDLQDHGRKCSASVFWQTLLFAAARTTSLFNACARLHDAPEDDAVRKALWAGLPPIDDLEERLNDALRDCVPAHLLRQRRRGRLAIDLTLIAYHGQPPRALADVFRGLAKSSTTHFHAHATCYLVEWRTVGAGLPCSGALSPAVGFPYQVYTSSLISAYHRRRRSRARAGWNDTVENESWLNKGINGC